MSDSKFTVTVPSPLPWRLSFFAMVAGFNGERFDLEAVFGEAEDAVRWEGSCDVDDVKNEDFELPSSRDVVHVTLEPL